MRVSASALRALRAATSHSRASARAACSAIAVAVIMSIFGMVRGEARLVGAVTGKDRPIKRRDLYLQVLDLHQDQLRADANGLGRVTVSQIASASISLTTNHFAPDAGSGPQWALRLSLR